MSLLNLAILRVSPINYVGEYCADLIFALEWKQGSQCKGIFKLFFFLSLKQIRYLAFPSLITLYSVFFRMPQKMCATSSKKLSTRIEEGTRK